MVNTLLIFSICIVILLIIILLYCDPNDFIIFTLITVGVLYMGHKKLITNTHPKLGGNTNYEKNVAKKEKIREEFEESFYILRNDIVFEELNEDNFLKEFDYGGETNVQEQTIEKYLTEYYKYNKIIRYITPEKEKDGFYHRDVIPIIFQKLTYKSLLFSGSFDCYNENEISQNLNIEFRLMCWVSIWIQSLLSIDRFFTLCRENRDIEIFNLFYILGTNNFDDKDKERRELRGYDYGYSHCIGVTKLVVMRLLYILADTENGGHEFFNKGKGTSDLALEPIIKCLRFHLEKSKKKDAINKLNSYFNFSWRRCGVNIGHYQIMSSEDDKDHKPFLEKYNTGLQNFTINSTKNYVKYITKRKVKDYEPNKYVDNYFNSDIANIGNDINVNYFIYHYYVPKDIHIIRFGNIEDPSEDYITYEYDFEIKLFYYIYENKEQKYKEKNPDGFLLKSIIMQNPEHVYTYTLKTNNWYLCDDNDEKNNYKQIDMFNLDTEKKNYIKKYCAFLVYEKTILPEIEDEEVFILK